MCNYIAFGFALAPFSVSATFFRIGSVIILFTYLNIFTIIPAIVFWFLNVLLTQNAANKAKEDQITSIYFMSFMGLFVPVYFSPEKRKEIKSGKRKMITQTQASFYRNQCLASLLCYLPPLAVCVGIVHDFIEFKYDSDIILDYYTFHFVTAVVLVEGGLSFLFSLSPGPDMIGRCTGTKIEEDNTVKTNKKDAAPKKSESTSKNGGSKEKNENSTPDEVTSEVKKVSKVQPIKNKTNSSKQKSASPKKKPNKENDSWDVEQVINIFVALILLGGVMFPIVLAFQKSLFHQPLLDHRSFLVVTNSTNSSHTIITEIMFVPQETETNNTKIDKIEANTEYFEYRQLKFAMRRFYYGAKLRIAYRQNWENDVSKQNERKDADDPTKVAAVLLIDHTEFKPTSNWKDAFKNSREGDTPIFLVRHLDNPTIETHLKEERTVGLFENANDIPEPEWHCDIPWNNQIKQKCFRDDNQKDGMYNKTKDGKTWIKGKSYMELECKWGGKTCKTSFNERQPGGHVRDYCNGADVNLCPLDNQPQLKGGDQIENPTEIWRNIYWSPDRCKLNTLYDDTDDNTRRLRSCDLKGDTVSKTVSGWTSLFGHTRKKVRGQDKVSRISGHRYCSIYAEGNGATVCIYKETVNVLCCEDVANCENSFRGRTVGIKDEKSCSKIAEIIMSYRNFYVSVDEPDDFNSSANKTSIVI